MFVLGIALLLALGSAVGSPASAFAAPADGPCTVSPSPINNLEPTLVTLRSASDSATDPISAHVQAGDSLVIRDPGADGTARMNQRTIAAAEQTVLGENIGFLLPAANIAGEFEVLTLQGEATSDCLTGASGVYDGLAVGQGEILAIHAEDTTALSMTIRGASAGLPLRSGTTVTLSTSRGEFVAVNGKDTTPSKVVQLTLTAGPPVERAAIGTVAWRPASGERAGSATITATALEDGVSLFKTVTGTVIPAPVPAETGIMGALPGVGGTALLVTTRQHDPAALANLLDEAGCRPQTVAVLAAGAWLVYVPGAPDAVNGNFPKVIAAETPFVLRCL